METRVCLTVCCLLLGLNLFAWVGHASRFIQNTAVEKLLKAINRFLGFRAEQEALLFTEDEKKAGAHLHGSGCKHAVQKARLLGEVATVNLTSLKAGVTRDGGVFCEHDLPDTLHSLTHTGKTFSLNVVPSEAEVSTLHIAPSRSHLAPGWL